MEAYDLDEAESSLASPADRVAVAGGDGSIGRGAGVAAAAAVPLAVLPVGTANDFARAMSLPETLDEAAALAVHGTHLRGLDLGRMGARPFVNVASTGLAPVAARRARGLKRALGTGAYAVGALRAALSMSPLSCRVTCDGQELFTGSAWQVTVACTGAFGGGSKVEADPRDGALDVYVIEAGTRVRLANHAWSLRRGSLGDQSDVHRASGLTVRVDVPAGTRFNVDGEVVGDGPVEFTVEPRSFDLVVG